METSFSHYEMSNLLKHAENCRVGEKPEDLEAVTRRCPVKKMFSKFLQKSQEKTFTGVSF